MLQTWKQYFLDIRVKNNLYLTLIWRFILVMLLFSVCRIVFYLINSSYFPNMTFVGMMKIMKGGLAFDTTAILYTNMLYFVLYLLPFTFRYNNIYQTFLKYLFYITNGIALLANCCDFVYFQFTLRRTTATIFSEFKHETNFGSLIPKFIVDYWYVVIIWIAMIAILVLAYGKIKKTIVVKSWKGHLVYFINGTILLLLLATLMIGGIRGGFRHSTRPITLSNAGQYINEPLEATIVLNTPFAIYRTLQKKALIKATYYKSDEELDKIYTLVHTPSTESKFKKQNVVIFILESFGREYLKSYNPELENGTYEGYTPFLDSLIQHSLMYKYSFCNGRKSIDAMPSVLASIPMMVEPYFLTGYSGNKINSIASVLRKEGYRTAFFHGAPNGSMGFQAFANVAGFKEYYGMSEYPNSNDFDGMWGVWDEEFFQYFASKLNEFKQPFCVAIFSVSSHHPFKVPERYDGKFKKGTLPIHQCIGYTDYSLKRFFETASKMPWYDSTLFVITNDHANQAYYPEFKTNLGVFTGPFIMYKPDGSLKGSSNDLVEQIDIMPSILGYLNYDKPYVAFGRNIFESNNEPFVITYTSSTYQLLMGDYLYLHNGTNEIGLFSFKSDPLLVDNKIGQFPDIETKMEAKLKAIIQQYNNRMIGDKLTVEK
ncbi:MAG: LTA synthase family protein [Bacteroidales bacterium]|nr:LTA synthase family protein [Bacteroidales bacterium]